LDLILRDCLDLGLNVVLDATMKSSAGVLRKAREFKSRGFRVEAHYMHLARQFAATRAAKRFCEQNRGRYIPVEVVLENRFNESNFDRLRPLLDAWSFWDNDVPAGTQPTYVSGQGTCALRE
jgi:predicted ABC-type ATPase